MKKLLLASVATLAVSSAAFAQGDVEYDITNSAIAELAGSYIDDLCEVHPGSSLDAVVQSAGTTNVAVEGTCETLNGNMIHVEARMTDGDVEALAGIVAPVSDSQRAIEEATRAEQDAAAAADAQEAADLADLEANFDAYNHTLNSLARIAKGANQLPGDWVANFSSKAEYEELKEELETLIGDDYGLYSEVGVGKNGVPNTSIADREVPEQELDANGNVKDYGNLAPNEEDRVWGSSSEGEADAVPFGGPAALPAWIQGLDEASEIVTTIRWCDANGYVSGQSAYMRNTAWTAYRNSYGEEYSISAYACNSIESWINNQTDSTWDEVLELVQH